MAVADLDGDGAVCEAGEVSRLPAIHPADNHGGRISFRFVVPFTCLLIVIFGILYCRDRKSGGYKVEKLTGADLNQAQRDAKVSV